MAAKAAQLAQWLKELQERVNAMVIFHIMKSSVSQKKNH